MKEIAPLSEDFPQRIFQEGFVIGCKFVKLRWHGKADRETSQFGFRQKRRIALKRLSPHSGHCSGPCLTSLSEIGGRYSPPRPLCHHWPVARLSSRSVNL